MAGSAFGLVPAQDLMITLYNPDKAQDGDIPTTIRKIRPHPKFPPGSHLSDLQTKCNALPHHVTAGGIHYSAAKERE
jgi:hypothetical protein